MPLVKKLKARKGLSFSKQNAMKLSDFILLSLEEKGQTALHEGILIGKRTNGQHLIFLFQVDAFYIEMFCNLESRIMEEVRVFDKTKLLTPYLEAIKIDDLFT